MSEAVSVRVDGLGVVVTIPLEIVVRLGTPQAGSTAVGGTAAGGDASRDPAPLRHLIIEARAAGDRTYYDEEADAAARADYYRNVPQTADGGDLYRHLSRLLTETHRHPLSYAPATHLYPWVDRQSDRSIRSLYTGDVFDVEELIREDFRRGEELARGLEALRAQEAALGEEAFQERVDALEAQFQFNCEHVVPQSWFSKRLPMRGDLHHLFACETKCNSFRGNTPYYDFGGGEERLLAGCGRSEPGKFEPTQGKAAAARATLYFLLRYPGEINASSREYTRDRLAVLIAWAKSAPVSQWEQHRNAAIAAVQGNRNPLIDVPEWLEKIDFSLGLGAG
jgi:endonuclease G